VKDNKIIVFGVLGLLAVAVTIVVGWHSISSSFRRAPVAVAVVQPSPEVSLPATAITVAPLPPGVDLGEPMDDLGSLEDIAQLPGLEVEIPVSEADHEANAAVAKAWALEAFTWSPDDLCERPWSAFNDSTSPYDAAVARANADFGEASGMVSPSADLIRLTSDLAVRAGVNTVIAISDVTPVADVDAAWGQVNLLVGVSFAGEPLDGGTPGEEWKPLVVEVGFTIRDGRVQQAIVLNAERA